MLSNIGAADRISAEGAFIFAGNSYAVDFFLSHDFI